MFASGHVCMWELDSKESWVPKNWCFWTAVLEKTLESPLDCKEIQPVHPKGDQSWVFIGRTDAEGETPVFWPPDAKSWLVGKHPDAGNGWGQEEKGTTEDEMIGRHHRLDGRGFGWTPGVGDGQGGLACCGSWGRKESDTTEQLNWTVHRCRKPSVIFVGIALILWFMLGSITIVIILSLIVHEHRVSFHLFRSLSSFSLFFFFFSQVS